MKIGKILGITGAATVGGGVLAAGVTQAVFANAIASEGARQFLFYKAAPWIAAKFGGLAALGTPIVSAASFLSFGIPILAAALTVAAAIGIAAYCLKTGKNIDQKIEAAKMEQQQRQAGEPQRDQPGINNPLLQQGQSRPLRPMHQQGPVDYSQAAGHPGQGKPADYHQQLQMQRQGGAPRPGMASPG